jgi:hypothetical protein
MTKPARSIEWSAMCSARLTASTASATWPEGIGNSPVASYEKIEAFDELDAAIRVLKMPLQREVRHDMYIRAMVRKLGRGGAPTKIYAAIN